MQGVRKGLALLRVAGIARVLDAIWAPGGGIGAIGLLLLLLVVVCGQEASVPLSF